MRFLELYLERSAEFRELLLIVGRQYLASLDLESQLAKADDLVLRTEGVMGAVLQSSFLLVVVI